MRIRLIEYMQKQEKIDRNGYFHLQNIEVEGAAVEG